MHHDDKGEPRRAAIGSLTPAHRALIQLLAEAGVEDYLHELDGGHEITEAAEARKRNQPCAR